VLSAPHFQQHLIAVCNTLNRTPTGHVLAHLPTLPAGSTCSDLRLHPSGNELVSDEELLLFRSLLLGEDEVAEVVEDCAFGAGGTGELVLEFHFSMWGETYEEVSTVARDCAH
jgi:hypothetical protein